MIIHTLDIDKMDNYRWNFDAPVTICLSVSYHSIESSCLDDHLLTII